MTDKQNAEGKTAEKSIVPIFALLVSIVSIIIAMLSYFDSKDARDSSFLLLQVPLAEEIVKEAAALSSYANESHKLDSKAKSEVKKIIERFERKHLPLAKLYGTNTTVWTSIMLPAYGRKCVFNEPRDKAINAKQSEACRILEKAKSTVPSCLHSNLKESVQLTERRKELLEMDSLPTHMDIDNLCRFDQ